MTDEEKVELERLRRMMQAYSMHQTNLMEAMKKDDARYQLDMQRMLLKIDKLTERVEELEQSAQYDHQEIRRLKGLTK